MLSSERFHLLQGHTGNEWQAESQTLACHIGARGLDHFDVSYIKWMLRAAEWHVESGL